MPEQASSGSTSRSLLDRILGRNKPRSPLVIEHLGAAQSTPVLNIEQAFHPASETPGRTALPSLNLLWSGRRFNAVVEGLASDVEEEMGRLKSKGFATFVHGMTRITELCSSLAKWRILCGPHLIEETTTILSAENCRVAMYNAPRLNDIAVLVQEAIDYDPLSAPAPDQARLFAWYRLLQQLAQRWEVFIRMDPYNQAAYSKGLMQHFQPGFKHRSGDLELLLEYGRTLNGITSAFRGSIGILMLLPQTFAICIQSYGSLALISFFSRLATKVPDLVNFCVLLEQQVLCAIRLGVPLNDTIKLFEDLNSGVQPRIIPVADLSRSLLRPRQPYVQDLSHRHERRTCGLGISSG